MTVYLDEFGDLDRLEDGEKSRVLRAYALRASASLRMKEWDAARADEYLCNRAADQWKFEKPAVLGQILGTAFYELAKLEAAKLPRISIIEVEVKFINAEADFLDLVKKDILKVGTDQLLS